MREALQVPQEEPQRQYYFMEQCAALLTEQEKHLGRKLKAAVVTFGCQMNARDSEKMTGILEKIGYEEAPEQEADFILYNTCTVRENANQKVYGHLGFLSNRKKKEPFLRIGLCGCMMQEKDEQEKIKKTYPFVDLVFGTHNVWKLAELLYESLSGTPQVFDVWEDTKEIVEDLPAKRAISFKSGVNIMFGCNNFCSYCIVPYVRGRERSRAPEDICEEIKALAKTGVVEVMLLGQNVNSYGKTLGTPLSFAKLLEQVAEIPGIARIRFMTSHPKDLSPQLIETMAKTPKICNHLHLPVQSGSSRILEKMNRHYTREDYLSLVKALREAMPDLSLTTDIIVGFPGETEEDFLETLSLIEEVKYDSVYTFLYSKRTGTKAASMEDQIPESVAKERFQRLLQVVQKVGQERISRYSGKVMEVLVEEENTQKEGMMTGRLSNNVLVHFPGTKDMIGSFLPVRLTECHGFYYTGEREKN